MYPLAICEAYAASGRWYVNIRYNYRASDCGFGACDFVLNWNWDYFTP